MDLANTHSIEKKKSSFTIIIIQKSLFEAKIIEPKNTEIIGTILLHHLSTCTKRKPYGLFEISVISIALNQENEENPYK